MAWGVWLTITVMLGHAVQMGMAAKVVRSKVDGCRHLGSGSQTKTRRPSVLCDPCQSVSLGNQSAGLISTVGQPYRMSGHLQRHRHKSGSRVLGRVRKCLTVGHERGKWSLSRQRSSGQKPASPWTGSSTAIVPRPVEQRTPSGLEYQQLSRAAAGSHLESGTQVVLGHQCRETVSHEGG